MVAYIKKDDKNVAWAALFLSFSAQKISKDLDQKARQRCLMVLLSLFPLCSKQSWTPTSKRTSKTCHGSAVSFSIPMRCIYIPVSKLLQGFLMALLSPFWQTIYTKHIYQPLNTLVQKQLHKQPMSAPPVRRDFQATLSKSHTNIPMFFLPTGLYIISRMVQIPCVVLCVYLHCPSARK
jgi:hypothetical protein